MTTQTLIKKIDKKVTILQRDIKAVKSMLEAEYRDPEGEYRPAFVKKMLKREKELPVYKFTAKKAFLKHIHAGKK